MISGKIVELRGISKQDAPLIYEWVNKEDMRDLTGTLYPISEYEHEKWIQNVTMNEKQKPTNVLTASVPPPGIFSPKLIYNSALLLI